MRCGTGNKIAGCWSVALGVLLAAGCAQYHYPYHPAKQAFLDPVFADVRDAGDKVDIYVDTHGLRMDGAWLATAEGMRVNPLGIDLPKFEAEIIGGMAGEEDPRYGSPRAQGPTVVHFDKKAIGPAPWTLHLDIRGTSVEPFMVGGAKGK